MGQSADGETKDSFTKWDLMRFFHENPHVTGTAEYIAWRAGQDVDSLRVELAELAAQGILVETQVLEHMEKVTVYSLSSNKWVRVLIRRFVETPTDRRFRARVLCHVLLNMGQRRTDRTLAPVAARSGASA